MVIDACVAATATNKPGVAARQSRECRAFLESYVRDTNHKVALSPTLLVEWDHHASRFSRNWRVQMHAKGRVVSIIGIHNAHLRANVFAQAPNATKRAVLAKDIHLIELALASEQAVISLDERARGPFHEIAPKINVLRTIMWVNPTIAAEAAFDWIIRGAPAEARRFLGY